VQTRGGIAPCFDKGAERTSAFGTQSISPPRVGAANANRAKVTAIKAIALMANDQWIPINPPTTPTVTPLKARNPKADMLNSPISRPRRWPGASNYTVFRFPLPSHLRQARVQGIAQRVAEEIEAHQGKENEKPRQENLQRSDENVGRGVGQ
jgi:hypothetical protein